MRCFFIHIGIEMVTGIRFGRRENGLVYPLGWSTTHLWLLSGAGKEDSRRDQQLAFHVPIVKL